jgi:cytochrome c553
MDVRPTRIGSVLFTTLSTGGLVASGVLALLLAAPAGAQSPTPEQALFFEKNVQPVLASRCSSCHSVDTLTSAGLSLDNREGVLKGGASGPAIVPGKPDESLLMRRITADDPNVRMPKGDEALTAKEIADLKTWIADGALWPLKSGGPVAADSAAASSGKASSGKAAVVKVAYPRPATPEQLEYFEKKVRPIFVNRCYNCHSESFKEAGGLRVDVGIAIFAGGRSGPVIIPGDPENSTLIKKVKATDPKKRMPQESKEALPPEEIAILETWIKNGAAWPDETEKLPDTPAKVLARYQSIRTSHWAWQPLTNPQVPSVANTAWPSSDIDRFILAKLDEKKLAPVKDADPDELIRRLSYDLTGLPPSPAEIKAFEKDHSAKAYSQLVDRLLASPQFGERWGRHWLDVARYAESSGPSRNMPYPNAWRYRDYVIDSYNHDVPYNRFIQEQIAGDLLPAETPADHDRLLIATGFLALGPKDVNQRFKARFKMDNVDDQIDTVTRSTMALTVSCARCHDHKFDPIPTKDYYSLASIFTSTDDYVGLTSLMGGSGLAYYAPKQLSYVSTASQTPVPQERIDKLKAQVEEAKKAFDASKANADASPLTAEQKKHSAALQKQYRLLQIEQTLIADLGERGYGIHSVHDGVVADTTVRVRGVEERHGPPAPRAFLSLVSFQGQPTIPADHSGRLELAEWITSPENPLTARVYVNRVWKHLFGTGIVSTVDNFGTMGDQPANPALLDYLAQDFLHNGWSTKKLVREMVLSRAYHLGSDVPAGYREIDPADHLVWRHAPRRLEAEEVRDSLLATSGQIDLDHPHGSPAMALRMIEIRDDGPAVTSILASADRSQLRSVYLPLLRGETPRSIAAFDPVVQTLVTGQRDATTVPTQSLFMLNSPFVRRQALILAGSLLTPEYSSDDARIREAYERVLGRDPKPQEVAKVKSFVADYSATWRQAHPDAPASGVAHAAPVAYGSDITAGVVRSDGLTQDDEVLDVGSPKEDAALTVVPGSAAQAAWGAVVQALYGSAEFQFVR